MGSRRREKVMRKNPFSDFLDDQLWLFNFHPISKNWNILISTHPFAKLKIVLESLWSREDMGNFFFSNFKFFTSENPCDSSPPPRRNHEPGTSEKFSKHGFSFFNPKIPISLETWTKSKIGCLFHDNLHLNLKNPFWQNSKKNFQGKTQKKPNLVCQNWVLTRITDWIFESCHFQVDIQDPRKGLIFCMRSFSSSPGIHL